MRPLFVLFFALLTFTQSSYALTFIPAERGGFERAKLKAKEEGKMLFLDFYANWCTPCKWMDETTFKDLEIKNLLEQKYIAVKVNIDDFEGFELKSKFDIRFLPTILIFNHEGKMIERVEETIGTQKMRTMLKTHADSNAPFIKHKVNTSPRELVQNTYVKPDAPAPQEEVKSMYRMQMGVFSTIDGAGIKSEELKQKFVDKVAIVEQEKEGKIFYKVLLGEFATLNEAKSFKKILEEQFQLQSVIL
jgi:thiol-disulfide isomerase/thioredoxin